MLVSVMVSCEAISVEIVVVYSVDTGGVTICVMIVVVVLSRRQSG